MILNDYIRISSNIWIVSKALFKAWTIREVARNAMMPVSTVSEVLKRLYSIGRVYFRPDYKKLGLIPIVVFAKYKRLERFPPFTFAVRKIYGLNKLLYISALVPMVFFDRWLSSLDVDKIAVVRGFEHFRWNPVDSFSLYDGEQKLLYPDFAKAYKSMSMYEYPVETWSSDGSTVDKVDMAVVCGRMLDPFMRPGEALERARRHDRNIPKLSTQALSYHVKRHVRPVWLHNTVNFYLDIEEYPLRVYYVEGRDSRILARILVRLPLFQTATIDTDKAVIIGQPLNTYLREIYEIMSTLDIRMPLCELILDPKNITKQILQLYKHIKNKKWTWPEEITLRSNNKIK